MEAFEPGISRSGCGLDQKTRAAMTPKQLGSQPMGVNAWNRFLDLTDTVRGAFTNTVIYFNPLTTTGGCPHPSLPTRKAILEERLVHKDPGRTLTGDLWSNLKFLFCPGLPRLWSQAGIGRSGRQEEKLRGNPGLLYQGTPEAELGGAVGGRWEGPPRQLRIRPFWLQLSKDPLWKAFPCCLLLGNSFDEIIMNIKKLMR